MGACLSGCAGGDAPRSPARKRSAGASRRSSAYSAGTSRADGDDPTVHKLPHFGLRSMYIPLALLGEGGTGTTYLCEDVRNGRRMAIKVMARPLAKVLVPMVSQEIQLQAQLSEGHLGLVRVESAVLSRSHLGLVMEYVDGGTLTQYVSRRSSTRMERGGLHLVEDEARYFFKQLLSAVEYLHKSHVAHRDLKMCNVVITERKPPTVKLCDFGFAKGWDDNSQMNTRIGTPVYMSPAQLTASKTDGKAYSATASDVWALGVMLFAMMLGRFPYDHFDHPDPNSSGAHAAVWKEMQATENGDWQKAVRAAPHVWLLSDSCRDLLTKMLQQDESKRITIPDIRQHAWFTAPLPTELGNVMQDLEARQARLDHVLNTASEEQTKRRNKAVHELVVLAGRVHGAPAGVAGPGGLGPNGRLVLAIPEGEGEGSGARSPHAYNQHAAAAAHKETMSAFAAAAAALSAAGGSARGTGSLDDDILVVELAAVARRTKSDGLLLVGSQGRTGDRDTPLTEVGCGDSHTEGGCGSSDDTDAAGLAAALGPNSAAVAAASVLAAPLVPAAAAAGPVPVAAAAAVPVDGAAASCSAAAEPVGVPEAAADAGAVSAAATELAAAAAVRAE